MRLTFESQTTRDVVVMRCQGRLVAGAEVAAFQAELERQTQVAGTKYFKVKWVVLNLAEVDFIDSTGLGALVRAFGVMRAACGSLNLSQVSPKVLEVLEITKLSGILTAHASDKEAIEAFHAKSSHESKTWSRTGVVCIDNSRDLLACVRGLLASSGYEVQTASTIADAKRLVCAMSPRLVICGAGILALPTGLMLDEWLRERPNTQVLHLPSDFSTAEAGQAGADLVKSVQSLLTN
ncbi:MAG TPA: STAS domain-containing protein [Terracidiphilus sp.]|jgi:anti-sigma B factor antagonist|nr:STAS domain-containing protein [Terracidiphilus sp.]